MEEDNQFDNSNLKNQTEVGHSLQIRDWLSKVVSNTNFHMADKF